MDERFVAFLGLKIQTWGTHFRVCFSFEKRRSFDLLRSAQGDSKMGRGESARTSFRRSSARQHHFVAARIRS